MRTVTPMRSFRRDLRVGLVAAIAVAGVVVPTSTALGSASPTAVERGLTPPVGVQGAVETASATAGPAAAPQPRLDAALAERSRGRGVAPITVEISGEDSAIVGAVAAAGGSLGRGGGGLYLATVSTDRLAALAGTEGVTRVRAPADAHASHVELPRVERGPITPTDLGLMAWTSVGYTGVGSKVGIIDAFDTTALATEIASGELPAIPAGNRYCVSAGATCPFGSPGATYGNSLAEIVADNAPGAQLYLAELGTRPDYYNVIDWMATNGVHIILNPIEWTYDGPGNGTGPSAAIVNYAVTKGIAWFNTSGEMAHAPGYTKFAGTYYRSYWNDPNNNRWMNFNGTDESLSVYCGMLLGLRWSDWGATRTDYDLYISDYNGATGVSAPRPAVPQYGNNQALAGAQPLEATDGVRLCNTDPTKGPVYDTNKDGLVSLWVKYEPTRSSGNPPAYDIIEIGTYYGWLEYSSDAGSAGIPFADSANAGMLTVGGAPLGTPDLPQSSFGPTNDGRQKPDVVSSMCEPTSLAGYAIDGCETQGYFGADAAAAKLAGYAAVARPVIGLATPAQIAALHAGPRAESPGVLRASDLAAVRLRKRHSPGVPHPVPGIPVRGIRTGQIDRHETFTDRPDRRAHRASDGCRRDHSLHLAMGRPCVRPQRHRRQRLQARIRRRIPIGLGGARPDRVAQRRRHRPDPEQPGRGPPRERLLRHPRVDGDRRRRRPGRWVRRPWYR